MFKLLTGLVSLIGFAALTSPALAQRAAPHVTHAAQSSPSHELGVDLAAQYSNQGDGIGGGVQVAEPVDVRLAFLTNSRVLFEPRLAFALDTKGTGTTTAYTFTPGLDLLYRLKKGTGPYGLMGTPYVFGGAQLDFVRAGVNNVTSNGTQFGLDAGLGKRMPFGSSAIRLEGFVSYAFQTSLFPRAFAIGTRVGLSFWR